MFVLVGEFRTVLGRAERLVHVDFSSCVSRKEKLDWFLVALRVFRRLVCFECVRAKESDLVSRESVCQAFALIVKDNFEFWNIKFNCEFNDFTLTFESINECAALVKKAALQLTKEEANKNLFFSSMEALNKTPSDQQVSRWERSIKIAKLNHENLRSDLDCLIKKGELILALSGVSKH